MPLFFTLWSRPAEAGQSSISSFLTRRKVIGITKSINYKIKIRKIMPQLIPFFFFNQIFFAFVALLSVIYIFSKYILPQFTFQQVIRLYITKLSNNK